MTPVLEVTGITKRFTELLALDRLSFTLAPANITGLLGVNGAGKTTLMRILTGTLLADSGEVTIAGVPLAAAPLAARRLIGYLGELPALYDALTIAEYLRFIAGLKGLYRVRLQAMQTMTEALGLKTRLQLPLRTLSKGYRQRVGLAAALMGNPPLLLLDEPTSGLDPEQANAFRSTLRGLSPRPTILFSSHILTEVAALSDDVKLLHAGELLAAFKKAASADAGVLQSSGSNFYPVELATGAMLPAAIGSSIGSAGGTLCLQLRAADETRLRAAVAAVLAGEAPSRAAAGWLVSLDAAQAKLLAQWNTSWRTACYDTQLLPCVELQAAMKLFELRLSIPAALLAFSEDIASCLSLALMARGLMVGLVRRQTPTLEARFLELLHARRSVLVAETKEEVL